MTLSELYGKPPGVSDDQARRTIEFCCPVTVDGAGIEWFNVEEVARLNVVAVTDALRWLIDRGDDTEGFRVVRGAERLNLLRFEERG
ncbi:hypothetical protein [Thermomonas sp.]|uniref:hypothetical protein n=1 Tax=Thermomonas sp. TaxID=1971895 RepID=UPI00391AF028